MLTVAVGATRPRAGGQGSSRARASARRRARTSSPRATWRCRTRRHRPRRPRAATVSRRADRHRTAGKPSGLDLVAGGDLVANPGGGTVENDVRYGGAVAELARTSRSRGPPSTRATRRYLVRARSSTSLAALAARWPRGRTARAPATTSTSTRTLLTFTAPGAGLERRSTSTARRPGGRGARLSDLGARAGATRADQRQGPAGASTVRRLGYMDYMRRRDRGDPQIAVELQRRQPLQAGRQRQWEGTLLAPVTRRAQDGGGAELATAR